MPMRAGIQELSVKGETIVLEGFYEIKFEGQAGTGLGVSCLREAASWEPTVALTMSAPTPSPGLTRFRPISTALSVRERLLSRGRIPSRFRTVSNCRPQPSRPVALAASGAKCSVPLLSSISATCADCPEGEAAAFCVRRLTPSPEPQPRGELSRNRRYDFS